MRRWLLLCAGLGLSCAPGSDWPFGRGGDDERPTSDEGQKPGTSDGDNNADDDDSGDDDSVPSDESPAVVTPRDAGTAKGDSGGRPLDGGAQTPSLDGGRPPPSGSGGDASDAGDGGPSEAGAGPSCTPGSDGRDYGACFGSYCQISSSTLRSATDSSEACGSDSDLELACDGEITRAVASCAQREVLSIGMGRSILACARRTPSLAKASEGCVDCYVDEMVCTMRNCLVACLDGSSSACTQCRFDRCAAHFVACSGLPALPRPVLNGGVDSGLPQR